MPIDTVLWKRFKEDKTEDVILGEKVAILIYCCADINYKWQVSRQPSMYFPCDPEHSALYPVYLLLQNFALEVNTTHKKMN